MPPSKTIFLTGFPGFIAERLVARLASDAGKLFLLVQPQFASSARESIDQIVAATSVSPENFVLIEGDIRRPLLGLSTEAIETLRAEVTDVFHLAAIYDLAVEKELAFAVNLEGTRNVNDLVRSLPNLSRYNYISTCYVAGRREGLILETELEHTKGFRNFYEETKYLAELDVEMLKEDLPVTIFRPSVVVGDSQTGETAKYDGIYYLIQYLRKAPRLLRFINVGNRNVRLNLVSVDFVVDGLAALSSADEAIGKTIALADPAPLTTAELFDVIAGKLSGKTSLIKPPPSLVKRSLMLPFSPWLTGLPHSAVPYFFLEQLYDTATANGLLAKTDVACPQFTEYADNLIDFVEAHPKL